ncbi:hypothetical protein BB558_003422 [Smittium angustum]|uniref:DUF1772 domain-containing protein n=1 Tax=Smittium angustum TaxID=133377 RepID=A0A2U1J618_SMIAN|nr:hypothetical protein BB558_003422 [Smittium angustum]
MKDLIFPASAIALFANGIFAGFAFTENYVNIPIIKDSSDPASAICKNLDNAKTVGVIGCIVGGISHLFVYYKTKGLSSMICGISLAVLLPYTWFCMVPTNKILYQMRKEKSTDKQQAFKLVNKWNRLHWVRTIIGTGTFVLAINEYTKA